MLKHIVQRLAMSCKPRSRCHLFVVAKAAADGDAWLVRLGELDVSVYAGRASLGKNLKGEEVARLNGNDANGGNGNGPEL